MNKDLVLNYVNQIACMKEEEFNVAILLYDVLGVSAKDFATMSDEKKELLCDAIKGISRKFETKYDVDLRQELMDLI